MPAKTPSRSRKRLQVKRVYETAEEGDGLRVLVDRLWPRGLTREAAKVDVWLKDLAPSDELRRRFHANLDEFEKFRAAYQRELARPAAKVAVETLKQNLAKGPVTLLFAARDEERNNAIALLEWLKSS